MARELVPRLLKGNPNSVNDLHRILYRLGLGTGPGAGFGTVRAIPVDALNKAASIWVTEYLRASGQPPAKADKIVRMIYAPLSDRTHPNFGATAPGMKATPRGEPIYTLRPEFDGEAIDQLVSGAFFMLIAAGEALDEIVAVATEHPTPFPPGEPRWHGGDLLKPGEASIVDQAD
jgi:hypothetical protein